MKKSVLSILLFIFSEIGFSQNIEIPRIDSSGQFVQHSAYSLSFNSQYMVANWSAYMLTRDRTVSLYSRSDVYLVDPLVTGGTADAADYSGSGYDRGHLTPAADMEWDSTANIESFYYSNMTPQNASFNRGIMVRLENQVRDWAAAYDTLYVVTGPVLRPGLPTIGEHNVTVPELFFKVILDYNTGTTHKGIGFIMPNQGSTTAINQFAVSIDSVEKVTGIDFYPALPDIVEGPIEAQADIGSWAWNAGGKIEDRGGVKNESGLQNIPNPFNPTTMVRYAVQGNPAGRQTVSVAVYTQAGNLIKTLFNGQQQPGNYEIIWNAAGQPSGVYIIKMTIGNERKTVRAVLVK
jgi:endonuclease G